MQAIEIIRVYRDELRILLTDMKKSEQYLDGDTNALMMVHTWKRWIGGLNLTAVMLEEELSQNSEQYMGIGIENWTGLTDRDGDRINFEDIVEFPAPDEDIHLYFQIKFIQNEHYSKIAKVSGGHQTDMGTEVASKLKRIGPGKDHPEILKQIHGDKP